MPSLKQQTTRGIETLNSVGFTLMTSSIVYFIIGSVAELVHGTMLDWTFCGSAHYLAGVEWCGLQGSTGVLWLDSFVHRLLNVTLPWFMMFWGLALVGVCSALLSLLGQRHRRLHDPL